MSPRSVDLNRSMRLEAAERILAAAEQVFARRGFFAATTDDVAREAGVSKGLVFNYFKTKDDLLEAILESHLDRTLRVWEDDPPAGEAPEMLAEIFDRTVAHVAERVESYRLYYSFLFQPGGSPALQRATDRLKTRVSAHYESITRAIRKHGIRNAAARAVLFQAAVNGVVQFILLQPELVRHPREFPLKTMREQLVRTTLE